MTSNGWLNLCRCVALLLALCGIEAGAAVPGNIKICNDSETTTMYVAQASQYGLGLDHRSIGWIEVPKSLGGWLGTFCKDLYGISSEYLYFAIAHVDENGRMAVYDYDFDDFGGVIRRDGDWFCVRLTGSFEFHGREMADLGRCEADATPLFFSHRVSFDDDPITIHVDPSPRRTGGKLATFDEIARGRYGAVAVGTGRYGYGENSLSRAGAIETALASCGVADCKVVTVVQGACAAIAYSKAKTVPRTFKVGTARQRVDAIIAAANQCREAHGECHSPIEVGCSGGGS